MPSLRPDQRLRASFRWTSGHTKMPDEGLLDAMPTGVSACDRNGVIIRLNPRVVDLWGRRPSPADRYSGCPRMFRPDGSPLPRDESPIAETLKTGKAVADARVIVERPDGSRVGVHLDVGPLADARGELVGAVSIWMILGDEALDGARTDNVAAREWNDHLRLMMGEASPVMLWVTDASDGLRFANRACTTFFGVSEARLRADWQKLLQPVESEAFAAQQRTAVTGGEAFVAELQARRADGQLRCLAVHGQPQRTPSGQLLGYVVAAPDITDLKEAIDEMRRSSRTRDDYLATVSHELRQPLHAAVAAMNVMLLDSNSERVNRAQANLERQIQQMNRIVGDLLGAARAARGAIQIQAELRDLRDAVTQAAEAVRPLMTEREHALEIATPPEPVMVMMDSARIQQVLLNVLTNAAKYTSNGGRVSVTLTAHDTTATLEIADTGRGIDGPTMPRIFELFHRVANDVPGFGVGLAVARQLVESHGGTIQARSDGLGRGSVFTISLPAVEPQF